MSAFAIEAAKGLRKLADPRPDGDKVKRAIERAARAAGLHYWRAYDIWYGKARRVDPEELEAIRAAKRARKFEARNELLSIAADFSALADRLARIDPDMAEPQTDAMRYVADRARRLADGGKR